MLIRSLLSLLFTSLLLLTPSVSALDLDIMSSTPMGSWSLREEITTDHKGRQTVTVTKTSLLDKEERNGQTYFWMEMSMDTFKLKKGKRKKTGDHMIMKSLVAESMLTGDPANAMQNLRGFGEEVIVKSGKNKPMRMQGAGSFAQGMLQGMGAEIKYDFREQGKETVSVPAGEFDTRVLQGTGSTEMKVLFKKIKVSSSSTAYYSEKIPFGLVKVDGESTTNGKKSTHNSVLLEYGSSGAQSEITEEVEDMPDMPAMPNMKDLFGG
ncbi:MAG: hypothetical protein AB8B48_04470 [Pseudomonadales bacterium]